MNLFQKISNIQIGSPHKVFGWTSLFVLFVFSLYQGFQINIRKVPTGDEGLWIEKVTSLEKNRDYHTRLYYRFWSPIDKKEYHHSIMAPLYPVLASLIPGSWEQAFLKLKILSLMFWICNGILIRFILIRAGLGPALTLVGVLVYCLTPLQLEYGLAGYPMLLFQFFVLLIAFFFIKYQNLNLSQAGLLGFISGLSLLGRQETLWLIPGIIFSIIFFKRASLPGLRAVGLFLLVLILVNLPWEIVNILNREQSLVGKATQFVFGDKMEAGEFMLSGASSPALTLFGLFKNFIKNILIQSAAISRLPVISWVFPFIPFTFMQRAWPSFRIFSIATLALFIVFICYMQFNPYDDNYLRYYLPVLPLVILFGCIGISEILKLINSYPIKRFFIVFIVFILFVDQFEYLYNHIHPVLKKKYHNDSQHVQSMEIVNYIKNHVGPNESILASVGPHQYIGYFQRSTAIIPRARFQEIFDFADRFNARYFWLERATFTSPYPSIKREALCPFWKWADSTLVEIKKPDFLIPLIATREQIFYRIDNP